MTTSKLNPAYLIGVAVGALAAAAIINAKLAAGALRSKIQRAKAIQVARDREWMERDAAAS